MQEIPNNRSKPSRMVKSSLSVNRIQIIMNDNSIFSSSSRGKIPNVWAVFFPTGWARFAHIWGTYDVHFWPKIIMSFYLYNVINFYQENFCIPRIWWAVGYRSILKNFIHWLLRYEHRFLVWGVLPHVTLPNGPAGLLFLNWFRIFNSIALWHIHDISQWSGSSLVENNDLPPVPSKVVS